MIDFSNIEYLREGNSKQQKVYLALKKHEVLEKLYEFDPILVGTVPLAIDIDTSDLDIICYWIDKQHFMQLVKSLFDKMEGFLLYEKVVSNAEVVIVKFYMDNFPVEIFGQNIPTMQQMAYRHLLIERRLLSRKDQNFRIQIIELKKNGLKTESAFAKLLGLEGDPYLELLKYEKEHL